MALDKRIVGPAISETPGGIISGEGNFIFINFVKYFSVIMLITILTIIIINIIKHKKIKRIFIILTLIFLCICYLAFFTDILRSIFPYYYGI